MLLVLGNKNYSSWSLRPWLAMKVLGVPFEERYIALYRPESKQAIVRDSPSGKVPCLIDGETHVWESLAILEYLAETHGELWPEKRDARAWARSICAEMHAGFAGLRQHMSMNVRKSLPGKGRTPESLADVGRIVSIWSECRARHAAAGPFLFGRFSAADAMYAPVVLRFRTYAVELPEACRAYAEFMLALPAMQDWIEAAHRETETIEKFELYD
ncbi:MAG: glutathione S-transferase family protein [Betaproteobacteria bacterium]|nr:glutathione S-transferase family protein [Betaproteobacteria bacterium]